jgi:uncharacterized membrane protein YgdD (TMEM256/DUF423 family)
MAEGWGPNGAGTALDALVAGYPWIKLHTAAPGAAGATAAATETTRKQATWNATGTDGTVENSNALTWTNIAGSQDATHFTAWSASTAGNFGFSGTVTANAYVAGDTFEVAIGDLDVSVTLAS